MTVFLRERATQLSEAMDAPDCDLARLNRTYAQFTLVNTFLSGWAGLYRNDLVPLLKTGPLRVLDVGCGGGDLVRRLARWTARDGLTASFVGIDTDPRAIEFAQRQPTSDNILFSCTDSHALVLAKERFDVVISNHVLHHLSDTERHVLCQDSAQLATQLALHNDIHRDDLAYALFPLAGIVCRHSFIVEDGLRSIRRAFTQAELSKNCLSGWEVTRSAPFRLQLLWRPDA